MVGKEGASVGKSPLSLHGLLETCMSVLPSGLGKADVSNVQTEPATPMYKPGPCREMAPRLH